MRGVYFGILALSALLPGCGSGTWGGASVQISALSSENYPVSGVLADPTGAPISGTITLSATDSTGAAVTLYADRTGGTPLTTANVNDGTVSFFVPNSAALPVTVKAIGNAPGRISSSALITITSAGESSFTIKLVNPSAAATTAGVASGTASVAAGATTGLAATLDSSVTTSDQTKTAAKVTIPATTVLKDASGTPLSGTLTATVTTFAPPTSSNQITESNVTAPSSLESFPGGLSNAIIAANQSVPAASGSFASAGFVAVNVTDSSGKTARTSDKPFTIRMDIPAGTVNPETGAPVVADGTTTIPIWTYNETDGTWKAEVDSTGHQVYGLVKQDVNGLYVEYITNHFSYWNLDWFYSSVCDAKLNLTNDAKALPLQLKATFHNGGGYLYGGYKPSGDGSVTVNRVPANKSLDIYLIDSSNQVRAKALNVDWCAQPNHTITMDYVAPAAAKPVATKIAVTEYCIQDNSVSRTVPSTSISVMDTGTYSYQSGVTGSDGTVTMSLLPDRTYNFKAYNRTNLSWVEKDGITIPSSAPINFLIPVQCTQTPTTGTTGSSGSTFQ